jgi:hypothetical protein
MSNPVSNFWEAPLNRDSAQPTPTREALLQTLDQVRQAAHEMAQSLTTILTLIELMAARAGLDEAVAEDVQVVLHETQTLVANFRLLQALLKSSQLEFPPPSP